MINDKCGMVNGMRKSTPRPYNSQYLPLFRRNINKSDTYSAKIIGGAGIINAFSNKTVVILNQLVDSSPPSPIAGLLSSIFPNFQMPACRTGRLKFWIDFSNLPASIQAGLHDIFPL